MTHDTQLLSISEAANRLGVSQVTLRNWANKGLIRHRKTPTGYRLFELKDLKEFEEAMVVEPRRDGDEK